MLIYEELGIKIKSSKEKIDVFDWNENFICSISKKRDYNFYVEKYGHHYAENKRLEYWYKNRKAINKMGTVAYYKAILLW